MYFFTIIEKYKEKYDLNLRFRNIFINHSHICIANVQNNGDLTILNFTEKWEIKDQNEYKIHNSTIMDGLFFNFDVFL